MEVPQEGANQKAGEGGINEGTQSDSNPTQYQAKLQL